ncbi:hypothetical protein [Aliikangiella coralliicola]|uniref:Uncharacterized protein n=1 Tax=Aliikangiella coralliicola TaxID=2592383 RepID=A0A545U069_9GAMM|nr:hypothetical protein [Aliikangiella coralliicola]TQV82864.1 hypothetical protein FLL46_24145 [Aliikangiella coralliicola]
MALETPLKTPNGIELKKALLVITMLSDSCTDNFHYAVQSQMVKEPSGNMVTKYDPVSKENRRRHTNYQVSIFGSEKLLREGQPPIGLMINEENQEAGFLFEPEDNDKQLIEQAYEHLNQIYPDAKQINISDLGLY